MNQEDNFDSQGNQTPPISDLPAGDYDMQTQGQPLSDFLMQLEDYNPTVR